MRLGVEVVEDEDLPAGPDVFVRSVARLDAGPEGPFELREHGLGVLPTRHLDRDEVEPPLVEAVGDAVDLGPSDPEGVAPADVGLGPGRLVLPDERESGERPDGIAELGVDEAALRVKLAECARAARCRHSEREGEGE
jgi:hypothetical protein